MSVLRHANRGWLQRLGKDRLAGPGHSGEDFTIGGQNVAQSSRAKSRLAT
jgi:hypothetical protein